MDKLAYFKLIEPLIPRILGQIDRDSDSPSFGSFDRNFWNYKIRDFSSAIIQQGILVLDAIYVFNFQDNKYYNHPKIKKIIEGGVAFWQKIQLKNGAFNEYYPKESGFPPTAFSLYAISVLVKSGRYDLPHNITNSINKAITWLLNHPETEALNQEAAALAAIGISSTIPGVSFNKEKYQKRLDGFINAQSTEGWFNEYGGPDIGYLSVTIDCLYDLFMSVNDNRLLSVIKNAAIFIGHFLTHSGETPVMINSRNTDYIVPYGLLQVAGLFPDIKWVPALLIQRLKLSDNQLYKTDDRYLCHYIGQSFFRILNVSKSLPEFGEINIPQVDKYFKNCGIYCYRNTEASTYISLKKGGVLYHYKRGQLEKVDFGWRYKTSSKIFVTHWQNKSNKCFFQREGKNKILHVKGFFVPQKYLRPKPLMHMALRILAFLFGHRLIPYLKNAMIFKKEVTNYSFDRVLEIKDQELFIHDTFDGIDRASLIKAEQYSLRHVSSAGRFTSDELF